MNPAAVLRPFDPGELEAVVAVYSASVHQLGSADYDAKQREAWAPRPPDLDEWSRRLAPLRTVVAEVDGALAGFVADDRRDHIALLFAAPAFARRGVGSMLYRGAERALAASGADALTTFASLTSRPFFEHHGFTIVAAEDAVRGGVCLRRFAMRKALKAAREKKLRRLVVDPAASAFFSVSATEKPAGTRSGKITRRKSCSTRNWQ